MLCYPANPTNPLRNHFFALTSRAMRHTFMDYARSRSAKEEAVVKNVPLDAAQVAIDNAHTIWNHLMKR
jgi:hypothetical protein